MMTPQSDNEAGRHSDAGDRTAPTSGQLLRSTVVAMIVAAVLLVTVVLPAEYGRDFTGVGRLLGLTEMGEIKMVLAEEAAANASALASADSIVAASEAETVLPDGAESAVPRATELVSTTSARTDTMVLTLSPGEGAEIKLSMAAEARAEYEWRTNGGAVNYDLHGDSANAPAGWFVSYKKGTAVVSDSGALTAGFRGSHGWFWRNRGETAVEIRLVTVGEYSGVTRP